MKTTRSGILLRLALAAALAATPVTVSLAQERRGDDQDQRETMRGRSSGSVTVPVSGTVAPDINPQTTAPVTGTFTIQRFVRSGNNVLAVGTVTASFTEPLTNVARTIVTQAAIPVDRAASGGQSATGAPADNDADVAVQGPAVAQQAVCDVLHLVLGPLDLNLLGLRVQLNQVVLDITAVPGAGNLLGNLLCAIVGLLDGPGPLAQLAALLNELLAILS
jgi:hypothetical protein